MLNRLAAVVALLLALTSLAGAQAAADADLARGIVQVQNGHWADAVATLNDVVERLNATAQAEDRAQAYLWLGIAHAQLDSGVSAEQSFRDAHRLDPRVSLAEGWPAKVSRPYWAARREVILPSPVTRTSDADAGLAKGIAQVQDGHWADAVSTLNDVVKRLNAPAQAYDLAHAYLWLGLAYAQLDSEEQGGQSFLDAHRLDPRVSLAEGWPAKVSRLFWAAKREVILPSLEKRTPEAWWLNAWRKRPRTTPSVDSPSPEEQAVYEKAQWLIDGAELDEAQVLLRDWMARHPKSATACDWLAEFLFRGNFERPQRFDEGVEVAERCLSLHGPKNARSRQLLANVYYKKAYPAPHDPPVTDEQKERYADRGLKYANLALEINPNLIDSIVIKGMLLRVKERTAKDEKTRNAYWHEANSTWGRATDLRKNGRGEFSGAEPPFPSAGPLPPTVDHGVTGVPSGVEGGAVGGVVGGLPEAPRPDQAVRVGGQIKEPKRLVDVRPVYPDIAKQARVQGIVIVECTIDGQGRVVDAKVMRGIPLLDQAAIDAVMQWVYTPTLLNGVPVRVIMTVVVNFRLS